MKTLTVRLPEKLFAEIEEESRATGVSKSEVVRRRLERRAASLYEAASDLTGVSHKAIPADLASRKKHYLKKSGYGRSRHR